MRSSYMMYYGGFCGCGVFDLFKQKTANEMRISDWSSDGCSSDLPALKLLLRRREAMHVRDQVDRHEADIMPVHRILGSGIAQAHPDLHRVKLPIDRKSTRLHSSH